VEVRSLVWDPSAGRVATEDGGEAEDWSEHGGKMKEMGEDAALHASAI